MVTNEAVKTGRARKPANGFHACIVLRDDAALAQISVADVTVWRRPHVPARGRGRGHMPAQYRAYIDSGPRTIYVDADRGPFDEMGEARIVSCFADDLYFSTPTIISSRDLIVRFPDPYELTHVLCDLSPPLFLPCGHGLYIERQKETLLFDALVQPDSSGLWWASSSGALERPATMYEVRHPTAPSPGWRLVDGAARSATLKQLPPIPSELDMRARSEKIAVVERDLRAARAALARHALRIKPDATRLLKLRHRAKRIARKLVVLGVAPSP